MTDKKLSDNEIIKALEFCANSNNTCDKCILYVANDDSCECSRKLKLEAVKLINRQKAEIERLNREIENLESIQEISPEAKHFVDTKADKVISLLNEVIKSQEQIKAEAYKEFAERFLSGYEGFDEVNETITYSNLVTAVKDVLKETGVKDDAD